MRRRGAPGPRRWSAARARRAADGLVRLAALAALLTGCAEARNGGGRADAAPEPAVPLAPPGAPADAFPLPARAVADIVAPRWSAEDERDDAGEAERVIAALAVRDGMHVADIGAGDGYYVAKLAPLVGDSGRVYAEDIVPRYLRVLAGRVRDAGWTNVTVVAGDPHDPRLPAASLDAAILVHMYHEIAQPFGLLWNLATALRPGGRVAILDLERPTWGHGTPLPLLRCELAAVGYRELSVDRSMPGEYLAVFEAPADRPEPAAIRAALEASPCTPP